MPSQEEEEKKVKLEKVKRYLLRELARLAGLDEDTFRRDVNLDLLDKASKGSLITTRHLLYIHPKIRQVLLDIVANELFDVYRERVLEAMQKLAPGAQNFLTREDLIKLIPRVLVLEDMSLVWLPPPSSKKEKEYNPREMTREYLAEQLRKMLSKKASTALYEAVVPYLLGKMWQNNRGMMRETLRAYLKSFLAPPRKFTFVSAPNQSVPEFTSEVIEEYVTREADNLLDEEYVLRNESLAFLSTTLNDEPHTLVTKYATEKAGCNKFPGKPFPAMTRGYDPDRVLATYGGPFPGQTRNLAELAVTNPDLVRKVFGWDDDGIEATDKEVQYIGKLAFPREGLLLFDCRDGKALDYGFLPSMESERRLSNLLALVLLGGMRPLTPKMVERINQLLREYSDEGPLPDWRIMLWSRYFKKAVDSLATNSRTLLKELLDETLEDHIKATIVSKTYYV